MPFPDDVAGRGAGLLDLDDVVGEFWRDLVLGGGLLEPCPGDLLVEPIPGDPAGARFRGFALVGASATAGGPPPRLDLSTLALEPVARRAEAVAASHDASF